METSYTTGQKWRLVSVLVGGIMVHLSLGTAYTFGNMNPYITSYMRKRGVAPDLTYAKCSWVLAVTAMGSGTAMTLGGVLEQCVGTRLASLIGCWIMSLGVFLTYLSIQHSFTGVVFTYGLMFGLGNGLAYTLPFSCAMKWLPHRKGLMTGLIVAGFGGGAFIFDQVQKEYVNPEDLEATLEVGEDKYFTEDSVLDNIPSLFLLLGACYATMQFIGCLLLSNPPSVVKSQKSPLLVNGVSDQDSQSYQRLQDEHTNSTFTMSNGVDDSPTIDIEIEKHDEDNYSPLQMVKTKRFHLIFWAFFFAGQGMTPVASLYKAYGLTFISDDTFLSWTGTFAAVFNGVGRIFWGSMADRFSFKLSAMWLTCCFTCLLATFQTTELVGESLYFIYVCLLFGCLGGTFVLFPVATAKCFGQKHVSKNYGILFLSQFFTAPIGVFAIDKIQQAIGWTGVLIYSSSAMFVSFLLIMATNGKDRHGKDI